MQRSSELPKPSGWENTNSTLIIIDGLLIVAATLAQRLDLALLATSGLAVGIFNGIQTRANDIYIFRPTKEDQTYYYFEKKKREWKIEK